MDVINAPLGEGRRLAASGGAALTTTASVTQLIRGVQLLSLTPRNFTTAVVAKVSLNPWLRILKTIDNMASPPTDYSEEAQDGSTATSVVLSSLNTVANGDYLLLGSHIPFRGLQVDVDGTNSTAATTVTISYWNDTWVDSSDTDGTKSSTHLDQDGAITWTVPSAWKPATLEEIMATLGVTMTSEDFPGRRDRLYWIRWEVDKALDSSVTLDSVCALNRSTAYPEYLPGQSFELQVTQGPGGIGCVEHLTNAGTANLVINGFLLSGGSFA